MISKKTANFMGIFWQISLETDQFCTDLKNVFNKKDGNFAILWGK